MSLPVLKRIQRGEGILFCRRLRLAGGVVSLYPCIPAKRGGEEVVEYGNENKS